MWVSVNTKNNIHWIQSADKIKLSFCVFPHKCSQSGTWIWFKNAYRVTHFVLDSEIGVDHHISRWFTVDEYYNLIIL